MSNSTTNSSNSMSELSYYNRVTTNNEFYFNIVSSSIGIPCNIISIFIFARLMRIKTNMGFLFIWQCSVDLLMLLLYLFLFRSTSTFGINIYGINNFDCKFLNVLRRFILHASSWIAVLTTFDRFTFVVYGHEGRFRILKKKRYLTCIIFVIFAFILILDIPSFFFYINKVGICKADFSAKLSSEILSILMRELIPFLIIVIFNIIIVIKIYKSKKIPVSNQTEHESQNEVHVQFTRAVIPFDVFFLIVNFPLFVYYIFYGINGYSGAFDKNALFYAKYLVANAVLSDTSFYQQTISFFIYLAFNRLFRHELLYCLRRICCMKKRVNTIEPVQSRPVSNASNHPL